MFPHFMLSHSLVMVRWTPTSLGGVGVEQGDRFEETTGRGAVISGRAANAVGEDVDAGEIGGVTKPMSSARTSSVIVSLDIWNSSLWI
ncbi:MAG: hypothetical protein R3A10_01860 [Caldilineaceae bacterium]